MPVDPSPARKKPKPDIADMKTLASLRGQAKAQVTRIRKAVEEASGADAVIPNMAMLAVYSRKLDLYFNEYRDFHHQIMVLCSDEGMEEQDRIYEAFEIQHTEDASQIPLSIQRSDQTPRIIVQQQPLKAPIPTFDGKPENWPRFKAMFLDVMRTSADSDAIKLYHLDRALVGAAAGIIDSRTLSENNYVHACKVLEERFENKRVIVDIHVNGLLNLNTLNRENAKDLRELIDDVTRHVDRLSLMKEEMLGVSERIVVNLIAGALDKDTRLQWESSIPHKELPKL
ncbi:uncharacterized protein LOC135702791 [Ochlerotatus camptorhynchus]|uniref:uncharacterized protein LOC135702791 n=1 Tax=Ochlerotatus camptorhynchus TaxID=644619 RepID=UPI0031DA730C